MAEHGSWPSIRHNGLLSTSALLDLFEINGQNRKLIESGWRRESVQLRHPIHGEAIIRDQRPLHKGVENFIDGMSRSQYYELLNGKTFFWVTRQRLVAFGKARAYMEKKHDVLFVETRGLVENHKDEVTLSRINSGAFFGSGRRGSSTFLRILDFPYEETAKKKGKDAVVELAVNYAVKDISKFTIKVEEWTESSPTGVIWERTSGLRTQVGQEMWEL